jgi:hypothetical protein
LDAAPRWYQWLHADHLGCPPVAPTLGGSRRRSRDCSVPGCLGAQSALPSKGSHLCFHHAQAVWGRSFVSCAAQSGCVLLDGDGSPDASVQVRPPPNTAPQHSRHHRSPSQHPVHCSPPPTPFTTTGAPPPYTYWGTHHRSAPPLATTTHNTAHHHRTHTTARHHPLATTAHRHCSPPLTTTCHHRSGCWPPLLPTVTAQHCHRLPPQLATTAPHHHSLLTTTAHHHR